MWKAAEITRDYKEGETVLHLKLEDETVFKWFLHFSLCIFTQLRYSLCVCLVCLSLWSIPSVRRATLSPSSVTLTSWWGRTTSLPSVTCTNLPSCTTSKCASWSPTTSTRTVVSNLFCSFRLINNFLKLFLSSYCFVSLILSFLTIFSFITFEVFLVLFKDFLSRVLLLTIYYCWYCRVTCFMTSDEWNLLLFSGLIKTYWFLCPAQTLFSLTCSRNSFFISLFLLEDLLKDVAKWSLPCRRLQMLQQLSCKLCLRRRIIYSCCLCRVSRDRARGHQPVRAAAHLWRGGHQRLQWTEHGGHGPSYICCGWGGVQADGQVRPEHTALT